MSDFSFKEVEKFIRNDAKDAVEQLDKLFSLILLFSLPMAAISKAVIDESIGLIADLLGVKSELSQLTIQIIEKIAGKKDKGTLAKFKRMEAAYCLICFTAFFEAIEQQLPNVMKSAELSGKEKLRLSQSALEKLSERGIPSDSKPTLIHESELLDFKFKLPHPNESFDAQKENLIELYRELSKGFLAFLEHLAVWDSLDERQRGDVKRSTHSLPNLAWEHFHSQYFALASQFEEFYIWTRLQETEKLSGEVRSLSKFVQKHMDLAEASQTEIDVGLHELAKAITLIPDQIVGTQANRVFQELENLYKNTIEEPVIKDSYTSEQNKVPLTFPKKSEIFIPQSYKMICYSGKEQLEDESLWRLRDIQNDLGLFLLSYFSSPYSIYSPLIILGHPGSGKSLLTNILAARLISPLYTPIRVELRDVNADVAITAQIEEQINKNTSRKVSWANLADHFKGKPALVLLDGYDELLQASGKAFSGYLLDVQEFQETEIALGREPVRAVVTSRITLIDKAEIPVGSTIIRLMEFGEDKREKWMDVWNLTNQNYFKQSGVTPFRIPKNNKKVISLAEQPLLLLMLALYDSESNELINQEELDQTLLYDRLLRRFVERERQKDPNFRRINKKEQVREIDLDIVRLGVAAIGMFNRRLLHITTTQLNSDLTFFKMERPVQSTIGRKLSQADLLLGSFFFVHESQSTYKDDNPQEREVKSAFEFLHNTFGEFLTADFIIREVLDQAINLSFLNNNDAQRGILEHLLSSSDTFPDKFYACLIFTPLFSRPVILEMMREWLPHILRRKSAELERFLEGLDIIVEHQINRIIGTNILPSMMTKQKSPFVDLPVLGYVGIYSLNLMLIRTLLSPDGYQFDEEPILAFEEGSRAWDRIMFLWRSWFPLENLNGLTAILTATRDGAVITLKAKEKFVTPSSRNKLDVVQNVSQALVDNITAGLSGLVLNDSYKDNYWKFGRLEKQLKSESITLDAIFLAKSLKSLRVNDYNSREAEETIYRSVEYLRRYLPDNLETSISLLSECIKLSRVIGGQSMAQDILGSVVNRDLFRDAPPEFISEFLRLSRENNEDGILDYVFREYFRKELYHRNQEPPISLILEVIWFATDTNRQEILRYIYQEILRDLIRWKPIRHYTPVLVMESIKLARSYRDQEFLNELYNNQLREYLDEHIPPRGHYFPDDILRGQFSLELAIQITEIAWQQNDQDYLQHIYRRILRESGDPRRTSFSWKQLVPNLILLARKAKNKHFLEFIYHECMGGDRFFTEFLMQGRPDIFTSELSIELIRLAKDLNNTKALDFFYKQFSEENRIGSVNYERFSDDFLVEIVDLSEQAGDEKLLESLYGRYLRDYLRYRHPQEQSAKLIILAYKLAKRFRDQELLEYFHELLPRGFNEWKAEELVQLIYFARKTEDKKLLEQLYYDNVRSGDGAVWPVELAMEVNKLAQEFNDNRFIKYVYVSENERELGTVRWFDPVKGYGFIKRDVGGDIFLHYSEVNQSNPFDLKEGQRVEYSITHDKKGPKAREIKLLP